MIAVFALEDIAGESVVTLNQNWARKDIVFPVDGGSIAGLVEDEQACFNVNRLYLSDEAAQSGSRSPAQQVLEGLLLNLESNPQRAAFITQRLSDWVDADFSPEGTYGAEDLTYTAADYPYLPPNQPLDSLSEFPLFGNLCASDLVRSRHVRLRRGRHWLRNCAIAGSRGCSVT